ncbi:MAG: hypothetical protein KDE22_05165, partial [Rhodobacterales bacterium]|nr:hypothetical protein [Rhodobacterales bacterium]
AAPRPIELDPAVAPGGVPRADLFLDLTDDRLRALLGSPDFRRRDNGAELWQYRTATCSFDLFLYPAAGRGHAVKYVDVRDRGLGAIEPRACLTDLLTRHARAIAG